MGEFSSVCNKPPADRKLGDLPFAVQPTLITGGLLSGLLI